MGHFNSGWTFAGAYLTASRSFVSLIKLWADDHFRLFASSLLSVEATVNDRKRVQIPQPAWHQPSLAGR
jgi:hypothetical protein